jgi:hypothetical protein
VRAMLRYAELVRAGAGEQERLTGWNGIGAGSARPWRPSRNAWSCSTPRSGPTAAG